MNKEHCLSLIELLMISNSFRMETTRKGFWKWVYNLFRIEETEHTLF